MKYLKLLFILLLVNAAQAATYYVRKDGSNTNTGAANTSAGAWLTLAKATSIAVAGDTVNIGAGDWDEALTVTAIGTATNPITFQGTGDTTVIGVTTVKGRYIHLKNYKAGPTTSLVGSFSIGDSTNVNKTAPPYGGDYCLAENITHTRISGQQLGVGDNGFFKGPIGVTIKNSRFTNPLAGNFAINFKAVDSFIVDCYFTSNTGADAITLFGYRNTIRNCKFENWSRPLGSSLHCDLFQAFTNNFEESMDHIIENNFMFNCTPGCQLGIVSDIKLTGKAGGWVFRNNVIVNQAAPFYIMTPNCKFYNNTLVRSPTEQGQQFLLYYTADRGIANNTSFYNNIFYKGGSNPAARGGGFYDKTVAGALSSSYKNQIINLLSDYNLFYGAAGAAKVSTVLSENNGNINSVNPGNPLFVNEFGINKEDYRILAGSAAIGRGVALNNLFSTDSAGTARGLTWDIGAFEYSQTTTSITQFGITWNFSEAREFGQFANGDYWVQGPVTITSMTPDWDDTTGRNGWMVNPAAPTPINGYSVGTPNYSAAARPALPLTLTSGSVIKTIGKANVLLSSIKTAAVLTVLENIPEGRGAGYFRPPYNGTAKPLNLVSSLRSDLLPGYVVPAGAPTLETIRLNFSNCLRLEHLVRSRSIRPTDAFEGNADGYQPQNTPWMNEAMLRLMGNESFQTKLPALIMFTQAALDKAYAVQQGFRSSSGDGHDPNHRIMAAWGATMLNLTDILTLMSTATGFHEDTYLYEGNNSVVLWGEPPARGELSYWDYIMGNGGGRSTKDPYFFVDGGNAVTGGTAEYQLIVSQSLKGSAIVGRLFPTLQNCFPAARWSILNRYAERWVTVGSWLSPDPVAPYDNINTNYGITFGPNLAGNRIPTAYIAGAGRGITRHGSSKDLGQYKSTFVANMWNAYSGSVTPPVVADTTPPTLSTSIINNGGNKITLTFSENVTSVNVSHYTLSNGHTLSSPVVTGRVVDMTISPVVNIKEVCTLSYATGTGRTSDTAGNLLLSITSAAVTNDSLATVTVETNKPKRRGNGGKASAITGPIIR